MIIIISYEYSDEQTTEAVITDVYRDPLDYCMEGIEDLATSILRTGKLSIQGEPGGKYLGVIHVLRVVMCSC